MDHGVRFSIRYQQATIWGTTFRRAETYGRIVTVGAVDGEARRVIDATNLVVAPGFIDVHSHDDVALINTPAFLFNR